MTVAVILGGGRSKRMGTNKVELTLEGRTLLERAVDAVTDASLAIVVADKVELEPAQAWPEVRFALENPPFGGPVAGIAAGVAQLSTLPDNEEVILLPADAVSASDAAGELAASRPGPDGVVLQDQQGWPQYLFGRYRLGSLRRALGELGTVRDVPVRQLGQLLNVTRVVVDHDLIADVDTPEQAREAGIDVPDADEAVTQ
ncbi:NTP transferase domain-containing protein [Tessaracoccus sp. OS52]|uniref:NTP transferase domain-containing protein n=1 Tax=Tessaracoccus sp. OS52 TaxID=2886691 RepID=UPI001D128ADD|nr:NTP transferase domain-containing protein [Tessaracoccus sp. OS52]MCC2593719.1 NTP transferase domain-containing protein [Tessaracoccus sp. OS52]